MNSTIGKIFITECLHSQIEEQNKKSSPL